MQHPITRMDFAKDGSTRTSRTHKRSHRQHVVYVHQLISIIGSAGCASDEMAMISHFVIRAGATEAIAFVVGGGGGGGAH